MAKWRFSNDLSNHFRSIGNLQCPACEARTVSIESLLSIELEIPPGVIDEDNLDEYTSAVRLEAGEGVLERPKPVPQVSSPTFIYNQSVRLIRGTRFLLIAPNFSENIVIFVESTILTERYSRGSTDRIAIGPYR